MPIQFFYHLLYFIMTILTIIFSLPDLWHILHLGEGVRKYWPSEFDPEEDKDADGCWRERLLVDSLNDACNKIAAFYLKVVDELMSAIRFWNTRKGELSHLSYIFHKPEPLGTEFKTTAYSITMELLFLEIQKGN